MEKENTKYFLNLVKRHCKLNTVSHFQINENEFVTSDSEILSECETFYKTFYTSQGNIIIIIIIIIYYLFGANIYMNIFKCALQVTLK